MPRLLAAILGRMVLGKALVAVVGQDAVFRATSVAVDAAAIAVLGILAQRATLRIRGKGPVGDIVVLLKHFVAVPILCGPSQ